MAKSQSRGDFRNVILSRLSPEHLESLRPHLHSIELEVKQVIYQPNQPIKDAYFVETGMISVVSVMEDGRSIEVGTIGREGVAGAVVLLGAKTVPHQYYVQIAGHGHRVDVSRTKRRSEARRRISRLGLALPSRVPYSNHAVGRLQRIAFGYTALLPLDINVSRSN